MTIFISCSIAECQHIVGECASVNAVVNTFKTMTVSRNCGNSQGISGNPFFISSYHDMSPSLITLTVVVQESLYNDSGQQQSTFFPCKLMKSTRTALLWMHLCFRGILTLVKSIPTPGLVSLKDTSDSHSLSIVRST